MSDKITLKNVGGRSFQVGTDDNREPIPFEPKKTASFPRAEAKRLMGLYPEDFEVVSGSFDEPAPAKAVESAPAPAAAPAPAPAAEAKSPDYNAMSNPKLKELLDEKGVKYNPNANKTALVALVEEAMAEPEYVEGNVYTVDDVKYVAAKVGDTDEIGLLPVSDLNDAERQKLVDEGKLTPAA